MQKWVGVGVILILISLRTTLVEAKTLFQLWFLLFLEPRVSRLLYQLVEDLLKLVTSSDYVGNADFEMELAKCIGTLGLMNLQCDGPVNGINTVDSSSDVLSDILSCFPNDVQTQQYCQIFHALNSYLVDPEWVGFTKFMHCLTAICYFW